MDADLLRRAARRLRETSGDADTWTWLTATAKAVTAISDRDPDVHQTDRAAALAVSDHLAVFSPLVGATLADLLDLIAERVEKRQWREDGPIVASALAVARAIVLEDLNEALTKEN